MVGPGWKSRLLVFAIVFEFICFPYGNAVSSLRERRNPTSWFSVIDQATQIFSSLIQGSHRDWKISIDGGKTWSNGRELFTSLRNARNDDRRNPSIQILAPYEPECDCQIQMGIEIDAELEQEKFPEDRKKMVLELSFEDKTTLGASASRGIEVGSSEADVEENANRLETAINSLIGEVAKKKSVFTNWVVPNKKEVGASLLSLFLPSAHAASSENALLKTMKSVMWAGIPLLITGVALLLTVKYGPRSRLLKVPMVLGVLGVGLVATGVTFGVSNARSNQEWMTHGPNDQIFDSCQALLDLGLEPITKQVSGTDASLLRYYSKTGEDARSWVIFFHGNMGSICSDIYLYFIQKLSDLPVNIAHVEYPGFSRGGTQNLPAPSMSLITENTEFVVSEIKQKNTNQLPLIVFGVSLGTSIANYTASRFSIDGMILLAPFTSLWDVIFDLETIPVIPNSEGGIPNSIVPDWLLTFIANRNEYPSYEWAERTLVKNAIVFHGEEDSLISIEQGRELSKILEETAIPESVDFVPLKGVDHFDPTELDGTEFWPRFEAFLDKVGG